MAKVRELPDADETSGTKLVHTSNGYGFDINNLPGSRKLELIESGELDIDRFVGVDNMPGYKLQPLRDAHRARLEGSIAKASKGVDMEQFKEGDVVIYKKYQTKIKEVDIDKKRVRVKKREGGLVWVSAFKVSFPGAVAKDDDEDI